MALEASDVINFGLLLIAILSLMVSLVQILKDKPKLDFSLYVAEIVSFPMGKTVKEGSYYLFKIVNAGHRPVTLSGIGGISQVPLWKWWIYKSTRCCFVPKHFSIFSPEIQKMLRDDQGSSLTLHEGEGTEAHLQIKESDLIESGGLKAMRFYVSDSVGRRYYLPCRAHKKLKKDIKEMILAANQAGR